jgi:hypothetical protein
MRQASALAAETKPAVVAADPDTVSVGEIIAASVNHQLDALLAPRGFSVERRFAFSKLYTDYSVAVAFLLFGAREDAARTLEEAAARIRGMK